MGRSQGGLTAKLHALVDGPAVALRADPGQTHDLQAAARLLSDLPADGFVIADKAYDADWIRELIEAQQATANIPDHSNRKASHRFSPTLYRECNRVERFFNRLKHCHRIATRYQKLAANFLAMSEPAAIRLWLRAAKPGNEATT
jgi:transposase